MILYHLTDTGIDAIRTEGLRPGPNSWDDWHRNECLRRSQTQDVVWLTTDKGFCMFRPGSLEQQSLRPTYQVAVKIPAHVRNLKYFYKLLRPEAVQHFNTVVMPPQYGHPRDWWVYFGTVPLEQFVAVQEINSGDRS